MCPVEEMLRPDPQQQKEKPCPICGRAVYGPGYHCPRCERDGL